MFVHVQWNLSIAATLGEQHFGRYIGVAFIEGLFCTQTVHLGPGCLAVISRLAFIQGWPLRGVPLYIYTPALYLCSTGSRSLQNRPQIYARCIKGVYALGVCDLRGLAG